MWVLTQLPDVHEIPRVFCVVIVDTSELIKRPPGGEVVSRITESPPEGALPLTDGVGEGEAVPEREGGVEGEIEGVAEGEPPGEAVAEALSGTSTVPLTMAAHP